MVEIPNFKITLNFMLVFHGKKTFPFAILPAKHFSYRKND